MPVIGRTIVTLLTIFILCCPARSQQVELSPGTLTFAPQLVNLLSQGSASLTAVLTNTGSTNLVIRSIIASGAYTQTNNCSTVVGGGHCQINVRFAPGTLGPINGAVTITDNAPSSPQVVSLFGVGLAPAQLFPQSLNFGTVPVGTNSLPRSLVLSAPASTGFSINEIVTSGNFAQSNNCPANLPAGQHCTINVTFHPTANIVVTGALAVSAVVGTTPLPFSVALNGTGSGGRTSQISAQPSLLNFGDKGPDSVDSVQDFTLTNTSTTTSVTIQGLSLSGSPNAVGGFPLYKIVTSTCQGLIAPGAHCNVQVAFSTTTSEVFPLGYPGAITISYTEPTSPVVVGIKGMEVEQLTFNPPALVFAPQPVNTTTFKTVTVTGNDTAAQILLDITTTGDFSETGNLAPCLLAPGARCTMTVGFTPHQTGTITGSVTLETYPECPVFPLHQCARPVILNLSGTGQ